MSDREALRGWWDGLSEVEQFNAYLIEKSNADALAADAVADRLLAAGVTLRSEPLDVARLTAAIERVLQDSDSRIGGPYAPLDSPVISVRFDRPAYAAAIAREYAALAETPGEKP